MWNYRYQLALAFVCVLSACSSTLHVRSDSLKPDTDPYWMNPQWEAALFVAVQSAVHNPVDSADQSAPPIHGKVQFTLVDGKIHDPEMIESTGRPDLDMLMLQQVEAVSVPEPTGPYAAEAHAFVLELDMPTAFESAEMTAINQWKFYPKEAIIGGRQGSVTIGFDYLDGKASNIVIAKSSREKSLDDASISAVSKAQFPLPPLGYAGKTLHMEVIICYGLNNSGNCPVARNVIEVRGSRMIRTGNGQPELSPP